MQDKLDGKSVDNIEMRIEELKRLFPEAVNEGRFDYDTFMTLLGDEFDNENEKYRFEWKGKQASLQLAQQRSKGTLRPVFNESKNWENTQNVYIEGDNLEVLKILQKSYLSQVKMIYIDPPYNTGNDFVYKDNFDDPLQGYKESTNQTNRANPETAGRYHSNWLSMMYPRLKIARTLLRNDGVIFISIDDNEQANLKKLCDEVFGEENFIECVIWEKKYAPQNDSKYFTSNHDFILVYARRIENFTLNLLSRTEEQNQRYKNPDNDPRGIWQSDNLSVARLTPKDVYPIVTPSGREVYPAEGRSWGVSQEKMQGLITDNRIWFGEDGNNTPRLKRFLSEVKEGITPMSIWKYKDVGHTQDATKEVKVLFEDKKFFDYPKPVQLMQRALHLSTKNDDLILDFFSGSSTTAHAVMQLNAEDGGNRRFIMVQLPEQTDESSEAHKAGYKTIAEIGKERIRRAGEKIIAEHPEKSENLDIGFKVFKLDSSNLEKWDKNFANVKAGEQLEELQYRMEQHTVEGLKADRREIDLVYEVLLKYGLRLTEAIAECMVNGKKFYAIGEDGFIFICLDSGITVEIIEQLVEEYTPGTLLFADCCFDNDNEISNIMLTLENAGMELRWI